MDELSFDGLGDGKGDVLGDADIAQSLSAASRMAAGFRSELEQLGSSLSSAGTSTGSLEKSLSRGLGRAMKDLVVDGDSLSDVLGGLATSMINASFKSALSPVTDQVSGLFSSGLSSLTSSILPFADGAAFSSGKVMPFARGGVVSSPTHFPMRGATGLMGEAGPEAILPLARGADGSLGVRSGGGGNTTVVMNVTATDSASFERSRGQIATRMQRAMARANRNA